MKIVVIEDFKINVIPFQKETPRFLSRNYYNNLKKILNMNGLFVYCFYNYNFFRNELNALIIKNGQIINIFGESFSKKFAKIKINREDIYLLFYFNGYNYNSFWNKNNKISIILDNFKPIKREKCAIIENIRHIVIGKNGNYKKYSKKIKIKRVEKQC